METISANDVKQIKIENDKKANDLLERKDFELNSLEYEEAIKYDKRNYFQYYFSLIKNNHPLIVSFIPLKDYNSFIIKMFLFFFSFSLDLTVNAIFFTDDTMHKIHEDKGNYDFLFQIPQIIYSTLISRFINGLINKFALTQDNILAIKEETDTNKLNDKFKQKLIKIIKIKLVIFFILCFIILMTFWFYITCFCGIYTNTQIHLIKDSVISLLTSFIMPFWQYLIPGLFRIPSLMVKKPTRKYLYKFSAFLENYIDLI